MNHMMLSTSEFFKMSNGSSLNKPLPLSGAICEETNLSTRGITAAAAILTWALPCAGWAGIMCLCLTGMAEKFFAYVVLSFYIGVDVVKSYCPVMALSAFELSYIWNWKFMEIDYISWVRQTYLNLKNLSEGKYNTIFHPEIWSKVLNWMIATLSN